MTAKFYSVHYSEVHSLFESLPRTGLDLLDGVFSPLHHPVLISTYNKVHCASDVINQGMYVHIITA